MKKHALFGAVLSIAVSSIAGCALAQPGPNPCNGGNCQVEVTVTGCTVSLDHPELHVARGSGTATIVWKIQGGTFARDNGIYIKAGGDPGGQVTSVGPSGSTWVMAEKRTPGTKISYGINVLDSAGKACPPHDPTVVNDM